MAMKMKMAMKASMKMKVMKAMKSMKKMKMAMKVSKIARGRGRKARVFSGKKEKTSGGLVKADLMKNKAGRVVSKKAHAKGLKLYKSGPAKKWIASVTKARSALGVKGFLAIGGKSPAGQKLLAKARSFYKK